jgi:glutaminyl-peptide cyclotransferase
MSDGSATLIFLDPENFTPVKKLEVKSGKRPVSHLNELEFIKGKLFANVWLSNRIAIIDPATGQVTAWLDLSGLLDQKNYPSHKVDVLNGIAYDHEGKRLFVTGKLWPFMFEIELIH